MELGNPFWRPTESSSPTRNRPKFISNRARRFSNRRRLTTNANRKNRRKVKARNRPLESSCEKMKERAENPYRKRQSRASRLRQIHPAKRQRQPRLYPSPAHSG